MLRYITYILPHFFKKPKKKKKAFVSPVEQSLFPSILWSLYKSLLTLDAQVACF